MLDHYDKTQPAETAKVQPETKQSLYCTSWVQGIERQVRQRIQSASRLIFVPLLRFEAGSGASRNLCAPL